MAVKSKYMLLGSVIATAILLASYVVIDTIVVTSSENQAKWVEAQAACPDGVWLAIDDIGPLVTFVEPPYLSEWQAAASSHIIYGFGCTRQEAQRVVDKFK